ncbi:hypothetical protein MAP00_008178 [Monascus purpureus]|nr:hypothetical protein MAP00_008178 [Monascus purpureus]
MRWNLSGMNVKRRWLILPTTATSTSATPQPSKAQKPSSSDCYLPVDTNGIPLDKIDKFPRNVTAPFILHTTEPQLDDEAVVESDPSRIPLDTRAQPLKLLGRFDNPTSRLHLEVHSTEPEFQFYTGEYIDVPQVEGAPPRGQCAGYCVKPGRYINAANKPAWRFMCLLKRGEVYGCKNVYKAWQE